MSKKVNIVGMLLLAVSLIPLYVARTTEASNNPDVIIANLEARLNKILSDATDRKNELTYKVTKWVNKFNAGNISRNKLCSVLDTLQNSSSDAHSRFDRKMAKVTRVKIRKLQNIGADPSYIDTAEDKEDETHGKEHDEWDELQTAIDNAKKVPSPWCT